MVLEFLSKYNLHIFLVFNSLALRIIFSLYLLCLFPLIYILLRKSTSHLLVFFFTIIFVLCSIFKRSFTIILTITTTIITRFVLPRSSYLSFVGSFFISGVGLVAPCCSVQQPLAFTIISPITFPPLLSFFYIPFRNS